MRNLQLTEQELTELFYSIREACFSAILERNADPEYSIEEKQLHEQHFRGVYIGAEVLWKDILNTIKYKNLVESNN
jgi:hypothetical protein